MSNHLRVNNDTSFLHGPAGTNAKNLTVDTLLSQIALDWRDGGYAIPGTSLVDYGPSMDGFSPTYKHVMPGCSQGNNVWIMRQVARLREVQGRASEAAELRGLAKAMAKQTIDVMYEKGKGFFNVVFPTTTPSQDQGQGPASATAAGAGASAGASAGAGAGASAVKVQSYEMRHAVDFFSITFGLCGACLLYTSPSPRDATLSRMPSSA